MSNQKCEYCDDKYAVLWSHGHWVHLLPGGKYLCTAMIHRGNPNKLKLFKLVISESSIGDHEVIALGTDKQNIQTTIMEGINRPQAYIVESKEILGPFKHGFVISHKKK